MSDYDRSIIIFFLIFNLFVSLSNRSDLYTLLEALK